MRPRNPLAEVPPDEFVKARDALVRKLRDEGQTEEARRTAALRRPSTALWAKAAERRQGFQARVDEQKRRVAEKRERILREREVQRAQQISRRLAARAEQLERFSAQARQAAEKAQAKARESRQAADAAAARLLQLRGRS